MRLSKEELEKTKQKYGVDRLWSWSKVNTFMTSKYEYYLKYVKKAKEDNDNCAYATLGGICHDILEKYYKNEISYQDMPENFNDGWLTAIDLADLKFNRNDEEKNKSIGKKYKESLEHFFKTHTPINNKITLEQFIDTNINGNIFQGYIDAVFKDDDGCFNIIDWKTSTKYTGNTAIEKSGQLVVYALGLYQHGIPLNKIKIAWNFLKYVNVDYIQKNGAKKTKQVERCKLGEGLKANVSAWLKTYGYNADKYIKDLIDYNTIEVLPNEIKEKYKIYDCYVYVDLDEKLIDKWVTLLTDTIKDIEYRERDYKIADNDKVFWDSEEEVKKESYYYSTLCGYSANLLLPYKEYLEKLEEEQNSMNELLNGSKEIREVFIAKNEDFSWLDNL